MPRMSWLEYYDRTNLTRMETLAVNEDASSTFTIIIWRCRYSQLLGYVHETGENCQFNRRTGQGTIDQQPGFWHIPAIDLQLINEWVDRGRQLVAEARQRRRRTKQED